jgi:glutamate dehydrogenase/leucine dehydrogenase
VNVFDLVDELAPATVLQLWLRGAGVKAVVAVDNVAYGLAIGGVRMAADAGMEEACRLARAIMTLKNAAAGLPHGGAKAVIVGDPKMPLGDKDRDPRLRRWYRRAH